MKPALWLCFFSSGAAALALELLWIRSAGLVVGATAATAASVLASYFGGLGIGGLLAREKPRSPVRRYGLLELGAAAGALWSWLVFAAASSEPIQRLLESTGLTGRVGLVVLAIVPATIALGATLPTLGAALATPSTVGSRGGSLYALNTVGGVIGIAAMGFGLPLWIGVRASYLVTAATSAIAGALALWVGDDGAVMNAAAERSVAPPIRLRIVAAGSGFLAIALEVLWIKLFAQVLHNSVYSFAAVSLVFLLAIAVGATAAAAALRRASAERVAAAGLLAAGVTSIVGLWSFIRITGGLGYFGMESGLAEYVARIVGLAASTAGPAALASGAVLPALWALYGEKASASRPIGDLTAANLAGAMLGALLTGFVALPALGMRGMLLVVAVGYVILADVVATSRGSSRMFAYGALLAIALLDPLRAPLTHLASGESVRATSESASGIVTLVDTGDDLQLRLDNFYVLGGSAAERNERRQGLIPLLVHPSPRRVAFIGMATGISASAAPALGIGDTTVIELVPEVAAMAGTHFAPWNASLLEQSSVRLVLDDGRRFLFAEDSTFDVIVSDLFIPWHAGAGNLYAREMYVAAARRLAPGGLYCQWLPLYQLTREEFDTIARTFLAVFPHVTLWRDDFYPDRPVVGLVGSREAVTVDLEQVAERLRALPEWAHDSLLSTPRSLAMLYLGDLSLARAVLPSGPINTDDRPVIEFLAPRLTRMSAQGDKDWFNAESLAAFAASLDETLAQASDPTFSPSVAVADARRAGAALFRYALAMRRADRETAERSEEEVRRLVPEIVAAGEQQTSVAALADVRRTLVDLKAEQERLRRTVDSLQARLGEGSGETVP